MLPISTVPTLWPIFEDALLVGATGLIRSTRFKTTVDASGTLLTLTANSSREKCILALAEACAGADAVLGSVMSIWSGRPLPENSASDSVFAMVVSRSSIIVLRARVPAFSSATFAMLGDIPCVASTVSSDGRWMLIVTPTPERLCGSNSSDCGYVPLKLVNIGGGDYASSTYNVSLVCPPYCPNFIGIDGSILFTPTLPGVVATGRPPPLSSGGVPERLPSTNTLASSLGIYYALACFESGIYTDPATGACTEASNPASINCAYGSGGTCKPCPTGGLCPGGARLWTRAGYWVPNEDVVDVLRCVGRDASARCLGWDIRNGRTQCGFEYLSGSFICGACKQGFFLDGDGTCVGCTATRTSWDRYSGLVIFLTGESGSCHFLRDSSNAMHSFLIYIFVPPC